MKTIIGYIGAVLLFAGLVLPLHSNKVEKFKYKLDYKIPIIESDYIDSSHHVLDSLVNFSEKNLRYLEHTVPRVKKQKDTIHQFNIPTF